MDAKIDFKIQDRSSYIPTVGGLNGGIVIRSKKGLVNVPKKISSIDELIDNYGEPTPIYPEMYSALNYLTESDSLYVVRAAADDIKYSSVLVRNKITPVPTSPFDEFTDNMKIIKGLEEGLTQEELDSFTFPLYRTNKLFEDTGMDIKEDGDNTDEIQVDDFKDISIGDNIAVTSTSIDDLNNDEDSTGEDEPTYTVNNLVTRSVDVDKIKLEDSVTVNKGDEIKWVDDDGNANSYDPKVIVHSTASDTKEVLVENSDAMQDGDSVCVNDDTDNKTTFNEKNKITISEKYVIIDTKIDFSKDDYIAKVIQEEYEDRDTLLIYEVSPGRWGNKISIGISPSLNFEEAYNVLVYYDGVLVENWEVTNDDFVNENGVQMQVEERINNSSKYIRVLRNFDTPKPLYTNYSVWQKDKTEIFKDNGNELQENILEGHKTVKLDDVDDLSVDDRIKFGYDVDVNNNIILSKEYKISDIDSDNNIITLDRELEEYEIDKTYIDNDNNEQPTKIYKFDPDYTDLENNIKDGYQYYTYKKLDKVFYNYPCNIDLYIDNEIGKLFDAGANLMLGGDDGSIASLGDMIEALNTLKNNEKTPITILMDGGFAIPAYAQEMLKVADEQDLTHCFLSTPITAEMSSNYIDEIVKYKESLGLNTEKASLFSGWIKIYDETNKKYVWISPESFGAVTQSYTYKNYQLWYPAAGYTRGRIKALDCMIKPNSSERSTLLDNKINPIKYSSSEGFTIWGNKTLYAKPSPLNDRSVAMLIIYIKESLKQSLKYDLFDLNTEGVQTVIENKITDFLREIKNKNGLYDFKVDVTNVTSDEDINNGKLNVYIGIQPTRSIEMIETTIAIFGRGQDIKVLL